MTNRIFVTFESQKFALASDIADTNDTFFYDPRIISISPLRIRKKAYFSGVMPFENVTIVLNNQDEYFNQFNVLGISNKPITITTYVYHNSQNSGTITSNMIIVNGVNNGDTFTITCTDKRKLLSDSLELDRYDTTTYTDLNPDNAGVFIPKLNGVRFGVPTICIDEMAVGTPSTYTFKICDTSRNALTSIDAVYVKGEAVTPSATSTANGTVTINTSDLPTDGDKFTTVSCDVTGNITIGVSQVLDLIEEVTGITYTGAYYNTTEVDLALTISANTSYYVESSMKLLEIIDQICQDISAVFYAEFDGLYSLIIFQATRAASGRVMTEDWIDLPKISTNLSQYITSTSIGYGYNHREQRYKHVIDKTDEAAALLIYDIPKVYRYSNSGIVTESDAQLKSDNIKNAYAGSTYEIDRSILLIPDLTFDLMEFIIADAEVDMRWNTYEIIGIEIDLINCILKYTFRYIGDYTSTDNWYNLVDEFGNNIVDEFGNRIICYETVATPITYTPW